MKLCYIANMPKSKNSDIELTLILSEWRFLRMSFWMVENLKFWKREKMAKNYS